MSRRGAASSSSSSSAGSSSGGNNKIELQTYLVQQLQEHEGGLSDEELQTIFGDRYGQELVEILNHLLNLNRLQLLKKGDVLIYKLIREETAIKFEGLAPEQMLVYQVCEKAGNRGIWTRDIKMVTNIPQHTLTKTLKVLEQRNLIKSVRSVVSKSKKLYMLYDIIPAKEITGGPWYTDQEFDTEFVDHLRDYIVRIVKKFRYADLREVNNEVTSSGVVGVQLSLDELESVLKALVFDGFLEEVDRFELSRADLPQGGSGGDGGMEIAYDQEGGPEGESEAPSSSGARGKKGASSGAGAGSQKGVSTRTGVVFDGRGRTLYKVCRDIEPVNMLTPIPCGVCPVITRCCDGGVISPTTCEYMQQWLEVNDQSVEDGTNPGAALAMAVAGDAW